MSLSKKTRQSAQKLINDYIAEYWFLRENDPKIAREEKQLWDGVTVIDLLKQPMHKRAEYADYVTKKICQHDAKIVCAYSELGPFSDDYQFGHPGQIGNFALVIQSLPKGKQREKIETNFNKVAGNTMLVNYNQMLFKSFVIGTLWVWLYVMFHILNQGRK